MRQGVGARVQTVNDVIPDYDSIIPKVGAAGRLISSFPADSACPQINSIDLQTKGRIGPACASVCVCVSCDPVYNPHVAPTEMGKVMTCCTFVDLNIWVALRERVSRFYEYLGDSQ